jgi:lon-related putative ATP-dependent protease
MLEPAAAIELDISDLRRVCDPQAFGFASTAEVEPLEGTVGQVRASEAISFGLEIGTRGYNIFATGPTGSGKRTALETRLRDVASRREPPGDWVYLHNFADPRSPIAVGLPSGQGRELAADIRRFIDEARRELTTAFESESYAQRQREVTELLDQEQEEALRGLREEARSGGIAIELTPAGVVTVPMRDAHPMTPAEFAELPEEVRNRYQTSIEGLAPRLQSFIARMRVLQREGREALRRLEREVALFAIGHLLDEIKQRHGDSPRLAEWLDKVAEDVLGNLGPFRGATPGAPSDGPDGPLAAVAGEAALARYEVNMFVTHDIGSGAPVVLETNPTYPNLFGRLEHQGMFGGGFATDHRMLRSGAVHRANGGYLMLPAAEVLGQPLVWLKLKEVLRLRAIRLENPADQFAMLPTTTLNPEPIDLDLKVVLVGSPLLYEMAYRSDEDVRKLFRVKAEFDRRMPWNPDGERAYAAFVASQVRADTLRHFDPGAVAAVIEHGGRLAESREWLSASFAEIAGLVAEASHWAASDGAELVSADHVRRAVERRIDRSNLIEQHLLDMVAEGTLLLDLDGARVGQVNGLSVLDVGDYTFGHPVRITASAGPGRGALVSIEREIELSGHIHDKGFLTLSGYLRQRYGAERRIELSATLTFEQSYEPIEGDSAASAELYALLSELAEVPVRQDIAVTGSVNQRGELQAIGGVNEKVEGFFRACQLAGLTGRQGVVIPTVNVQHLMLSDEIVEAVRTGRFHVWSAGSVDEGIELLTGVPAGTRGSDGRFPEGSLHAKVDARLERWAGLEEEEEGEAEAEGREHESSEDPA